jgi:hypothetical protein
MNNPLFTLVITIVMCGGKLKDLLVFDEMNFNQDQNSCLIAFGNFLALDSLSNGLHTKRK